VGEEVLTHRQVEIDWKAPDRATAERLAEEIGVKVLKVEPEQPELQEENEPEALTPVIEWVEEDVTSAADALNQLQAVSRPLGLLVAIIMIVIVGGVGQHISAFGDRAGSAYQAVTSWFDGESVSAGVPIAPASVSADVTMASHRQDPPDQSEDEAQTPDPDDAWFSAPTADLTWRDAGQPSG
jgi:hypothetical protein